MTCTFNSVDWNIQTTSYSKREVVFVCPHSYIHLLGRVSASCWCWQLLRGSQRPRALCLPDDFSTKYLTSQVYFFGPVSDVVKTSQSNTSIRTTSSFIHAPGHTQQCQSVFVLLETEKAWRWGIMSGIVKAHLRLHIAIFVLYIWGKNDVFFQIYIYIFIHSVQSAPWL